jgi:predicted nucleotidyltransferase component of viral defense system
MSLARAPKNLGASVRARLLELARRRGVEFQLVLSEFAIERLLYRLGASSHAERFVLKGAMLFKLWSDDLHRATWDLDLLGRGANTVAEVMAAMRELCAIDADDGIVFDLESLTGEEIRAAEEYAGVRVRFEARLAGARIPVQVDVGFGDAIVPTPIRETYPTLLAHESPRILVYPREAVVAEKLEAMVTLGVTNGRMKDFYDVHLLASSFPFDGPLLARAIRAAFERRGTPLPATQPLVLTREFLGAPERQILWRAFLRRGRLQGPPDAAQLAEALQRFLGPVLMALAHGGPFSARWQTGGPWEVASPSRSMSA